MRLHHTCLKDANLSNCVFVDVDFGEHTDLELPDDVVDFAYSHDNLYLATATRNNKLIVKNTQNDKILTANIVVSSSKYIICCYCYCYC